MNRLLPWTLVLLAGATFACTRSAPSPFPGASEKVAIATPDTAPCRLCVYDLSEHKLTGTLDDENVGAYRFPIRDMKAILWYENNEVDVIYVDIDDGTDETPISETSSPVDVDLVQLSWADKDWVIDDPPPLADIIE